MSIFQHVKSITRTIASPPPAISAKNEDTKHVVKELDKQMLDGNAMDCCPETAQHKSFSPFAALQTGIRSSTRDSEG
jgi:hypothetical protein